MCLNSLLSGIVFAVIKIAGYFKNFAHESHETNEKSWLEKSVSFIFQTFRAFRGQIFLVFKATAIFVPLSNGLNYQIRLIIFFRLFQIPCRLSY